MANKRITPEELAWSSPQILSSAKFQLVHLGPYMERDTSQIKDKRVEFLADDWQVRASWFFHPNLYLSYSLKVKVLDGIDARKSLLVVAPTSAGKTFISFYAMEQVLRDETRPDGVVVYVAPTKALVNQTSAEVYAKFAKASWLKDSPGIQTCGVFTRDYRYYPSQVLYIHHTYVPNFKLNTVRWF